MDILKALKREEAKLEKTVKSALKHLVALRAAMKIFGGAESGEKTGNRSKMSASARARISKAQKARWAKVRAAKAKKAA
jgi:hypothetical protein